MPIPEAIIGWQFNHGQNHKCSVRMRTGKKIWCPELSAKKKKKSHTEWILNWVLKNLLRENESKEERVLDEKEPSQCKQTPQGGMSLFLKSHQEQSSQEEALFNGIWQRSLPRGSEGRLHGVVNADARNWLASSIGAIISSPTKGTAKLRSPASIWRMLDENLHFGWNKWRESRVMSQILGRTEMENKGKSSPARTTTWWNDPERPTQAHGNK